jgi:hypothetical protein
MNDAQLIERVGANDRYSADVPLPDHMTADVVLLEIERRMHVQTQDRGIKPVRTPNRRPAWLVVAVAAIVVLVVGVTAFLLSGGGSDVAPADTIPTTTQIAEPTTVAPADTIPPTTQPEPTSSTTSTVPIEIRVGAAEAVAGAMNARDSSALVELLAPGATILPQFQRTSDAWEAGPSSVELLEQFLAVEYAFNTNWQLGECSHSGQTTSCEIVATSPFHDAMGFEAWPAELQLRVNDAGAIERVNLRWSAPVVALFAPGTGWSEGIAPFVSWLEANHPEDVSEMLTGSFLNVRSTPESAVLWDARIDEYLASLQ